MRLVTFRTEQGPSTGAIAADGVVDLPGASDGRLPAGMSALLGRPEMLSEARDIAGRAEADPDFARRWSSPLRDVRLLAPVPRPGKVVCLGLNYRDHAAESGIEVPSEPVIFGKASSSVIGPQDCILLPETSAKVDYEVELAFVIGARAKNVSACTAMEYVAGYTVLNDVSARDYQLEKPGGQWFLGKSFDTFCPTGPWIVTADEIQDPHNLALSCQLSGETMQQSNTSQMVFRIPDIIEYISRVFALEPGDVVATGTPPGVGFARRPPRMLQRGDVVRCTVESIGSLENRVQ